MIRGAKANPLAANDGTSVLRPIDRVQKLENVVVLGYGKLPHLHFQVSLRNVEAHAGGTSGGPAGTIRVDGWVRQRNDGHG